MANYPWLRYANQGKIRNQPVSPQLAQSLAYLADLGVTAEVFSGGQDAKGKGSRRTGSTRHDHGNAADVFFYKDGKRLDWSNPEHLPVFEEIVARGRANGLTGFGAGPNYMQPGSMHIGFGNEAVWGAGGKGENAPGWLRSAFANPDKYLQKGPARSDWQATPDMVQKMPADPSRPIGRDMLQPAAQQAQPASYMAGATQTPAGPLHTGTPGFQPPPAVNTPAGPLHTGTPDVGGAMWGQPEKESLWDKLASLSEEYGSTGQQQGQQQGGGHIQMAPIQQPGPETFTRRDSGYRDALLKLLAGA